jgi:excisionase family DNA binding protein
MTTADRPLTTSQVAALFNVHPATVNTWAESGKLPSFRTPGGRLRFRRADVERFTETDAPPAAAEASA